MRAWLSRVLVIGSVVVTACAPPPPTQPAGTDTRPAEQRAANQVLRISTATVQQSASPEASAVNVWGNSIMFDSLTRLDAQLRVQPGVAERWEALPNNEGWRYTIRRDLFWPDGTRVTAADVEFTMRTAIANRWPVVGNFANVTAARLIDENTVDLLTRQLDVSVLPNGAYLFIVPARYYEQVGREAFATRPIGSGPYELAEFRPGDTIVYRLRANANHPYRRPNATEIRIRAVPEASAALAGLRTNELDLAIGVFQPEQVQTAQRENLQVLRRISSNYTIVIDLNSTRGTPFEDRRVRQALNYAIDRDTIVRQIFQGAAIPVGQLSIPGAPMWDDANQPFPFDQRRARELLAQAGYPNGFRVTGGIDFSGAFHSEPLTLALQDYLRQIGVEAQINAFDGTTFQDRLFGRDGRTRNELFAVTYGDANGMFVFGRSLFTCANPPPARIVCVPEFDRLMAEAYAEPDDARRAAILRRANRAFIDELPVIFMIASSATYIQSAKLRGFEPPNVTFWTLDSVFKVE